jgi:platelet-activating factor acetylhydrolase IB subunit alpha
LLTVCRRAIAISSTHPCPVRPMASLLLTDRQRQELNVAILDYLSSQGDRFINTIQAFKADAGLSDLAEPGKALLEKKWTSVIRLQKRVMELEAKVEQLQHQKVFGGPAEGAAAEPGAKADSRMLPKPPAKATLQGHRASVTVVITHPIYSLVASGSEDTTIRIWDHETAQYERTLKGHTGTVTGLAFDNRGAILASCSNDMSAKLWDMNTYTCTKTLKGHDHTISAIVFTPSSETVITCSRDQSIKCWDVSTGYCSKTFNGHSDWVKCLSVSQDGLYLASGSSDQTILIWQIASGTVIQVDYIVLTLIDKDINIYDWL